jgi:hypothetical protein
MASPLQSHEPNANLTVEFFFSKRMCVVHNLQLQKKIKNGSFLNLNSFYINKKL